MKPKSDTVMLSLMTISATWCVASLHRHCMGYLKCVHFFLKKQLNQDFCELCWRISGWLPDVAVVFFFFFFLAAGSWVWTPVGKT